MNWRGFWFVFLGVQLGGLLLAMSGLMVHFYAVIAGILLLFPGAAVTSFWTGSQTPLIMVASALITIVINAPFWISVLRPASR